MPDAVLRVRGEGFDPRPFLAGTTLEPYDVYLKGDRIFPASSHPERSQRRRELGGFQCDVSDDVTDLASQAEAAVIFLQRHYGDLARLRDVPEVQHKELDFGYDQRIDGERVLWQFDYLPPKLVQLAGELGLGIELSLYMPLLSGSEKIETAQAIRSFVSPVMERRLTEAFAALLAPSRRADGSFRRYGVRVDRATEDGSEFDLTLTFLPGERYCCAEAGCHLGLDDAGVWLALREVMHRHGLDEVPSITVRMLRVVVEPGVILGDAVGFREPAVSDGFVYRTGPYSERNR